VERAVRRNVIALGADFGLYLVGLSFASPATILPAFASHLGAPNVVIGAIPAVMTAGWFVPSLFAAGHTERLARKLPFVLRYTVWERVPFLVLVPVALFVADRAPGVALALLLLLLVVIAVVGGVLMPAWMDVVGRAVPLGIRGRFFALANLIGSAGGILGSAATAYALAAVAPPRGYGFCFLGAAAFMASAACPRCSPPIETSPGFCSRARSRWWARWRAGSTPSMRLHPSRRPNGRSGYSRAC
jgi:MFS family permease